MATVISNSRWLITIALHGYITQLCHLLNHEIKPYKMLTTSFFLFFFFYCRLLKAYGGLKSICQLISRINWVFVLNKLQALFLFVLQTWIFIRSWVSLWTQGYFHALVRIKVQIKDFVMIQNGNTFLGWKSGLRYHIANMHNIACKLLTT